MDWSDLERKVRVEEWERKKKIGRRMDEWAGGIGLLIKLWFTCYDERALYLRHRRYLR
jgi:hypothetical protein